MFNIFRNDLALNIRLELISPFGVLLISLRLVTCGMVLGDREVPAATVTVHYLHLEKAFNSMWQKERKRDKKKKREAQSHRTKWLFHSRLEILFIPLDKIIPIIEVVSNYILCIFQSPSFMVRCVQAITKLPL